MNYERQLKRLSARSEEVEKKHKGKEAEYTYHGGFTLGYLQGQVSILEEIVADLSERKIQMTDQKRIEKLEKELLDTKLVLTQFIAWSQLHLGQEACDRLISDLNK
jgi:hypothetical protein